MYDLLFSTGSIGRINLRNRSIRAAAFEGMCPGNHVSDDLINYHVAVARGGIGMTTVAYASVSKSGLSFPHQLYLTEDEIPALQRLTGAVHKEGAAVSVQIGHCGRMADVKYSGTCIAPSGGLNLYGPTWAKTMTQEDIRSVIGDFGKAVMIARKAGFDAVEVHAGHGYLISQFLCPYTNRRKDKYGGSFENRSRFLKEVIREVLHQANGDPAVIVKMNMRDGFSRGSDIDEAIEVAKILETEGVDALVLSGGCVSKTPMYVMRGSMPIKAMAHYMKNPWMRTGSRLFARFLIKPKPFSEAFFLEDALKIRSATRLPLIYVGGLKSGVAIEQVLQKGFEFVQIARALVHDPGFVGKLKTGEVTVSGCNTANFCIAHMYSGQMICFQHHPDIPESWRQKFMNGRSLPDDH
ncbi:MAG: NADH:flavin oxidoreductase [Bacteroidales bacterium]|mgnify:CR=1 FL=1|nr:NADH:flavin oxidoreductase [Bacteroidales bacterium]HNW74453.1 NADH:flavin oxidoreductase [Bacteroidales bacterium]HPS51536.1 NADH:flavin oxidoreductase [Bacteroidales bacterium]